MGREERESTADLLTLYREEHRYAYFAEHLHDQPFFDEALGAWVVTDPDHSEVLLQSPSLEVTDYAAAYESLERNGTYSFTNLRFAFSHISLALNGADHRATRRATAEMIARNRTATAAAIPRLVAENFSVVRNQSEVDWMRGILAPLVARVMAATIGFDGSDPAALGGASVAFDRMLGPRKRLRLEEQIGELRKLLTNSASEELDEAQEGLRLALLIVGGDSLLGTLGESLYRVLKAHPGHAFSAISFPAQPPETGVPYVERVVAQPFEFAGCSFSRGERVRFLLQALLYSDCPADRARIFGFGLRTCLGRPLSLDLWKQIVAELSQVTRKQEVLSYVPRSSDYVFTCPEVLLVRTAP